MDILNNLFTNIYNAINAFLNGLLGGAGLRPDAASAIVAAIMGLIVGTVVLLFGVGVVLTLIWLERKVAARVQDRVGPNRVRPFGMLQPVADTIKMFIKEDIVPTNADGLVHLLAPVIALATEGDARIAEHADEVVYLPHVSEELAPVVATVPLQLLAYHVAIKRGTDVDQPRNLAKSVTVE